jgi:hypothetical protein
MARRKGVQAAASRISDNPIVTNQPKEVLAGGRLKGGVFKAHLAWLAEHRPASEKQRFLDALSPESRTAMSGSVLSTNWYPFAMLIDVDRTLMNLFGGGKLDFLLELGRYSAINLSTTYRAFNRDTNHDFFRNSAILHSQFQDFGKARYEQTGESSGRMIHSEYTSFSPIYCASARGYYEGCVMSHGAARAKVTETECQCLGAQTCTFEMSWT